MSGYDDGTYSNGASGECQECGDPTEEEWHALCSSCYAEEQGWKRPARPAPGTPPESFVAGLAQVRGVLEELILLVASLKDRIEELERGRVA